MAPGRKRGRKKWSPKDGVTRQRPSQAAKTNAQRGSGQVAQRPRSPYSEMRMQSKSRHTMDRPGYGPTGMF